MILLNDDELKLRNGGVSTDWRMPQQAFITRETKSCPVVRHVTHADIEVKATLFGCNRWSWLRTLELFCTLFRVDGSRVFIFLSILIQHSSRAEASRVKKIRDAKRHDGSQWRRIDKVKLRNEEVVRLTVREMCRPLFG